MSKLILVRHGQSIWNSQKRFTGWVDVDLTEKGKFEAHESGKLIKEEKIEINYYYSSFQLRAKNTLKLIQNTLDDNKPFIEAWELNERHYGSLTGLNKDEMSIKLGKEKVYQLRRSWDIKPESLKQSSSYHPFNIKTYDKIPREEIPDSESLKDTYKRVIKFYKKEIESKMKDNNILISAHGNSLRALCKHLFKLDEKQILELEIPTGNPLLINISKDNKVENCRYLDKKRSKDLLIF